MKRPIVSILVPVYNVEKYLEKCLESLIKQTLYNIEIICVNDGSTDNSLNILEYYKEIDSRISIVNKKNGGLPSARNAGLEKARGKYVGFVDSDDYVELTMFEKLVQVAETDKADVVICGANIFPQNPKANKWLYDCLSPKYTKYNEFHSEIVFDRNDTSPFLWRCLISNELIQKYKFRLDEDIVIGEDKAFQVKVFPYASRITVIEDKLYNYLWCREDSLMQKQVYSNMQEKVLAHAKLVGRIGNYISEFETLDKNEGMSLFLEWSIPFIYDDFLYLNCDNKKSVAQLVLPIWDKCRYANKSNNLPVWKKEAYNYISKFKILESANKSVSIIIPLENTSAYYKELEINISQLDNVAKNTIDFIIINNGISEENYLKVIKIFNRFKSVRIFNTPKYFSYAEVLNVGMALSEGEYLTFMESHDWYKNTDIFLEWVKYAIAENADICTSFFSLRTASNSVSKVVNADEKNQKIRYELDFHNLLYRNDFIKKKKLKFTEASVITGYAFMCNAMHLAASVSDFRHEVYICRELYEVDWIRTDKCEKILETLNELMEISLIDKNQFLHSKILNLLNGDKLKKIIVNNTKPYCMPTTQCPNGENSQIRTVKAIFNILKKANYKMLEESGFSTNHSIFDTIYEVIKYRHRFLSNMSGKFQD